MLRRLTFSSPLVYSELRELITCWLSYSEVSMIIKKLLELVPERGSQGNPRLDLRTNCIGGSIINRYTSHENLKT